MQAAPKAFGQVPFTSAYPQEQNIHPSRQPLPQSSIKGVTAGSLCGFFIAASLLLTPLALMNVSVRAIVAENGYRMQHIRNDIEGQKEVTEKIRLDNAKLASLERVKKVAVEKLAMTDPTVEAKIISMPANGVTSPEYAYLTEKEVR